MRRALLLAAAFLAAGCARPAPSQSLDAMLAAPAQPALPVTPPAKIPVPANFLLVVSEIVGQPSDDIGSYVEIFIDNGPAGETQIAVRSQDKTWDAALPPGNHLFRFKKWELPETGDWIALDPQYQPPERFIRIVSGEKITVHLKFYDGGRKNSLAIERQPLRAQ